MTLSLGILAAVAMGFALVVLKPILVPLAVAYFLANAAGPPVDFLKRRGIPRAAAFAVVLLLFAGALFLLGELFYRQALVFRASIDGYDARFRVLWQGWLEALPAPAAEALRLLDWGELLPGKTIAAFTLSAVGGIFNFLGILFLVLLYMAFLLVEREGFGARVREAFGGEKGERILQVLAAVRRQTEHYVAGKTLVSLLTGALVTIMLLLFGVRFYLVWGILAFLLNYIPNIGSLAATVLPLLFSAIQPDPVFGAGRLLFLAGCLAAIQFLVGSVLEPRLLGRRLSLSPLVVLVSLVLWGWLWGIPGAILSTLITAAVRIVMEQVEGLRPLAFLMAGGGKKGGPAR